MNTLKITDDEKSMIEKLKLRFPIVRVYAGYIILAQSESDYENKRNKILHGDTRGFYIASDTNL